MAARRIARLGLTPDVLRAALHDRDLRMLQLGWMATNAAKWAFFVTNLVYVYQAAGPAATGVLGLATFLPATIVAPLAGLPAARWRPEHVLVVTTVMRLAAVGCSVALVAVDGPLGALLGLVALEGAAGAFGRPLHMSILPLLARTPSELVAANVASSTSEGIGTFAGPAISSLLIGVAGFGGAHLAVVVLYAFAVAAVVSVRAPALRTTARQRIAVRAQLSAGARALARLSGPRVMVAAFAAQTGVRGALVVLTVVAAIELLGMGEPGVGVLSAAFGAGGVLGAVLSIALAGRGRLAPWVTVALAAWGAPIALIAWIADPVAAIALLVMIGVANAVLDVAGFTLLQRTTPNDARIAVLGLFDSLASLTQAIGGLVAPVLVVTIGIHGALVVTGLFLPLVALASFPAMRRLDDQAVIDPERLGRIRAEPLFAPLSLAIVEELAGRLEAVAFPAGSWIMREGDRGDRFYLILTGDAEVSQGGRVLRRSGAGESFGEIALLRDVPRTASVRALTELRALALERDDFLGAVTGHPTSRGIAEAVVERRVDGPLPGPS